MMYAMLVEFRRQAKRRMDEARHRFPLGDGRRPAHVLSIQEVQEDKATLSAIELAKKVMMSEPIGILVENAVPVGSRFRGVEASCFLQGSLNLLEGLRRRLRRRRRCLAHVCFRLDEQRCNVAHSGDRIPDGAPLRPKVSKASKRQLGNASLPQRLPIARLGETL